MTLPTMNDGVLQIDAAAGMGPWLWLFAATALTGAVLALWTLLALRRMTRRVRRLVQDLDRENGYLWSELHWLALIEDRDRVAPAGDGHG